MRCQKALKEPCLLPVVSAAEALPASGVRGSRLTYLLPITLSLRGSLLLLPPSRSVVSDSVRPHRRQPTRPRPPWDSPGKNTGVGCHFLLQCMKVKSEREVTQSCLTPSDPMDCSPPGSYVPGIPQARVLEWGAMDFSRKGRLAYAF